MNNVSIGGGDPTFIGDLIRDFIAERRDPVARKTSSLSGHGLARKGHIQRRDTLQTGLASF